MSEHHHPIGAQGLSRKHRDRDDAQQLCSLQRPSAKRSATDVNNSGEQQVEIDIDETALHACDDCGFRVHQWPRLLHVLSLREDCLALHAAYPEENFFLEWLAAKKLLEAAERPALLGYVAELLELYLIGHATSSYRRDWHNCGAEFWVQRRCSDQSMDFHWDKDGRS